MIQLSVINILNSTHSEYVITDNDHNYELRKIKDYINSLFERLTTEIDASIIKIINDLSSVDIINDYLKLRKIHSFLFKDNINIH